MPSAGKYVSGFFGGCAGCGCWVRGGGSGGRGGLGGGGGGGSHEDHRIHEKSFEVLFPPKTTEIQKKGPGLWANG